MKITKSDLIAIIVIFLMVLYWVRPQTENPDGKDDMRRDRAEMQMEGW